MSSNVFENLRTGQIHTKIVDVADKILHQFNAPVVSADFLGTLIQGNLTLGTSTLGAEWKIYLQMAHAQRLQLETLFSTIHGLDDETCAGFCREAWRRPRVRLLRSILLSLASLIFLKTCTTIFMETKRPDSHEDGKTTPETQLVSNEGIPSLIADFELMSYFAPG